jgi:hypothetical protein
MHDPQASEDIAKQVEAALVEQELRASKVDTRLQPIPIELDPAELEDDDDDDLPSE